MGVFCFYSEQVVLLSEQSSFEVDMAFKRVRDTNIKELVFAKYMNDTKRGRPLFLFSH
jgi:hypothetical protein